MYLLTEKCLNILDSIGYNEDRVFNNTSGKGWTIGKTRKFVALGMTKEEGVKNGFLMEVPDNPLRNLCGVNSLIPVAWVARNLTPDMYTKFIEWMRGQGMSEYGFFSGDVIRFMNINSL